MSFKWDDYLKETGGIPAPKGCFKQVRSQETYLWVASYAGRDHLDSCCHAVCNVWMDGCIEVARQPKR